MTAEGKSEVRFRFPRCRAHDAEERLRAPSFLDLLRALTLAIPRDDGAPFPPLVAGMLGFDHVDCFEALPANPADPTAFPDALFRVSEALIVAEPGGRTRVVSYGASAEEAEAALGGPVAGLRALPPPGPAMPEILRA